MERTMNRGGVIGGIALATLGSLLLLQPIVGLNLWAFSWPYFVVVPGLLMLFSAFRWAPHTSGVAIPGSREHLVCAQFFQQLLGRDNTKMLPHQIQHFLATS